MVSEGVSTASGEDVEADDAGERIRRFVQQNIASLGRTLRFSVTRAGLATVAQSPEVAREVLHDTIVEALRNARRFDATRGQRAWLLGIAGNIIKRRRVERAKRHTHEVSMTDAAPVFDIETGGEPNERISDTELFDRFATFKSKSGGATVQTKHREVPLAQPSGEQDYIADEEAEAILARCSPKDQAVLRLALLEGVDGKTLAQQLGVPPGVARVRLIRALDRLKNSNQLKLRM